MGMSGVRSVSGLATTQLRMVVAHEFQHQQVYRTYGSHKGVMILPCYFQDQVGDNLGLVGEAGQHMGTGVDTNSSSRIGVVKSGLKGVRWSTRYNNECY